MVCATAIAVNPDQRAVPDELPSPPANGLTAHWRLDRPDVDLLHLHQGRERPRYNFAAGGQPRSAPAA